MKIKIDGTAIAIALSAAIAIVMSGGVGLWLLGFLALFLLQDRIKPALAVLISFALVFAAVPNMFPAVFLLFVPGFFASYAVSGKGLKLLERALIAYHITILFIVILYLFSFSGIFISKALLFFTVFLLPLLLAIPFRKRIIGDLKGTWEATPQARTMASILLVVLFISLVWSPILAENKLQRTVGLGYFYSVYAFEEHLKDYGEVLRWDSMQDLGVPIYNFDPILYPFAVGYVDLISGKSTNANMNYIYFYGLVSLGLAIYALGRRFSLKYAALAAVFFLANPLLASLGVFTGYSKTFVTMSAVPMLFILLLLAFKNPKYYTLYGLVGASAVLGHLHVGAFGIFFSLMFALIYRLYERNKPDMKEALAALKGLVIVAAISAIWIAPALYTVEYTSHEQHYDALDMNRMFTILTSEPKDPMNFDYNVGLGYLLLPLAGLGVAFSKKRSRVPVGLLLPLALLILFILLAPSFANQFTKILDVLRIVLFSTFLLTLIIPFLLELESKQAKLVVGIILLIVLAYYSNNTHTRVDDWFSERAQGGIYQDVTGFLGQSPKEGRMIAYGTYGSATGHALVMQSKRPHVGHNIPISQYTDIYFSKLYNQGDHGPFADKSTEYTLNMLRMSWSRYVFNYVCAFQGGKRAYEQFAPLNLPIVYSDNQCSVVIELEPGGLAEKVKLSDIRLGEEELYSQPEAWKVIGIYNPRQGEEYDYVIDSVDDIANVEATVPLETTHKDPEKIVIQGDFKKGDWILIKESYFPNWKARITGGEGKGGTELQILQSNLYLMLLPIDANGTEITLTYEPFDFEYGLSILATLAIILVFALPALRRD